MENDFLKCVGTL